MRIGNTREVLQALLQFEADLGLIEGTCHERDLRSTHWCDDEMVVVVGTTHPLAQRPVSRQALREADWIVREPGSGTREVIEQRLVPVLGELRFALELGNAEAIKRTVMSGFGISCLSLHVVAEELERGQLVALRAGMPPWCGRCNWWCTSTSIRPGPAGLHRVPAPRRQRRRLTQDRSASARCAPAGPCSGRAGGRAAD